MGGIIGGITDAIGLTNSDGEDRAAELAAQNSANGYAMSKEQIAFAKEQLQFQKDQYADWKNIYGDIQTNLASYYKNLNPADITAMGLQNQQTEFQAAVKALEADFAQKGLGNSGMVTALKSNATIANAEARAKIRTEAPQKVAEQKLGFLGVGLGQGAQYLGLVGQAANTVNNAYGTGVAAQYGMAGQYLNQQTQFSTNNTNAMGNIFGTGTGFFLG